MQATFFLFYFFYSFFRVYYLIISLFMNEETKLEKIDEAYTKLLRKFRKR